MHPQTIARVTGVLFLITFVTSIVALVLYQPVLDHPVAYVTAPAPTTGSSWVRCSS